MDLLMTGLENINQNHMALNYNCKLATKDEYLQIQHWWISRFSFSWLQWNCDIPFYINWFETIYDAWQEDN